MVGQVLCILLLKINIIIFLDILTTNFLIIERFIQIKMIGL